ncbi:zinc-dependent metalloprotease [Oligoflexia bacterium]|nr:zinc-dependent metalloprotease [Oligoflexia bacterium]
MRSFTRYPLISLLIIVICCVNGPAYAERVELRGNLASYLRGESKTLLLHFRTPSGLEAVRLKLRKPFAPTYFVNGERAENAPQAVPILFQGQKRRVAKDPPQGRWYQLKGAAATIQKNLLTIHLIGRRGRAYELTADISAIMRRGTYPISAGPISTDPIPARIRHMPRNKRLLCAVAALDDLAPGADQQQFAPSLTGAAAKYELEVATDADAQYYATYGDNSISQMQSVINDVEAIYLSQLSIDIALRSQGFFTSAASQPYSSSDSGVLLEQFTLHENTTNRLGAFDVAHLFSGKNLKGGIIGLAYLARACSTLQFSLSQDVNSSINFITVAHEIAHNLAASHDWGDTSNGPNNPVFKGHIMNASVVPSNSTFSDFSIVEILDFAASSSGSCLSSTAQPLSHASKAVGKKKRKKITFKTSISFVTEDTDCVVSLFGSKKQTKLENATDLFAAKNVVHLGTWDITSGETLSLSTKVKNGSAKKKSTGYTIAEATCAGGTPLRSSTDQVSSYYRNAKKLFIKTASVLQ